MNQYCRSEAAFEKARKIIPGGVNSPVRAFKGVGGIPVYFSKANGAFLTDIDGNTYIDFVGSWGPMILGHAFPSVIEQIVKAAQSGTSFGAPTEAETELAELIISMIPSIEMVRLVSSGTEATMSAIRLARGYTGRDLIVKFEGCYHGHGDSFLIAAGSGAATLGVPNSPGVPESVASCTLLAKYNDIGSVKSLFAEHGNKIAAIIVEPVAGNMGVVAPADGFLQALREITIDNGSLLIFDEVMTGFRVSSGGAQMLYGIEPDLTTLGKIVGGGMPIGAYGGKKEIMSMISPSGPVYQAGTLSGNPVAVAAGIETLKTIKNNPEIYLKLEKNADRLAQSIIKSCKSLGIPAVCNRVGSMMTLFFTENNQILSYDDAKQCDTARYARYFHAMLKEGIYLPPSQFEAWFISAAHNDTEIDNAIDKNDAALSILSKEIK
ncbi:MAG: glutamate-1-semialdehyde 2,1-aminomutase [Fibrobacter sp.]|jgi:glutamate-1-semialdehyde 2,1-aminomutase|nr:glutamate-1-semialdehyde 2,1-aminomutase [Fibrobacter sp.]